MKLYFLNGPKAGTGFELVPPGICIGREVDNDIQLLVEGVSRYHAKIDFSNDQWILSDMGSTNGTRVDGKPLKEPLVLSEGMMILIGGQKISVGKAEVEPAASVPEKEAEKTPEPEADPVAKTMTLPKSTDIASMDIFAKQSSEETAEKKADPREIRRKRLLNILFYVVLVSILLFGAKFGIPYLTGTPVQEQTEPKSAVLPQNSFYLRYEKKIISSDNIFRFCFELDKTKVFFVLDDLKYSRRYRKKIMNGDPEKIRNLISTVRGTNFMTLVSGEEEKSEDGVDRTRILCVGYDKYLNTVRVKNSYPKPAFEIVEQAVTDFASACGLQAISLSPQEMQEKAESSFQTAEELFRNYQARPENLKNAIINYETVVDFLESCDPHPKIYIQAKQQLARAKKILKKQIDDANFNINLYFRNKRYADAVAECNKLLQFLNEEDPVYEKTHQVKLTLEKKLSADRKKNRRK